MKKLLLSLLVLLALSTAKAQEGIALSDTLTQDTVPEWLRWPRNVQGRIDQLVQEPLLDRSQLGLFVWDLTADSAIYRYNEHHLLRPASTMKLVTAITALDRLGGNYAYKTTLYYQGEVANRTLCGNLYVMGGMDPMLDNGDLDAFARALQQLGIDTIRGTIVCDKGMKDTLKWGEGWCWDDDNPDLSALSVGRDTQFGKRFIEAMTERGMGTDSILTADGTKPTDATIVCTRQHSIDQVLYQMMKDSDNFFAESMLFQTAASTDHRPATASDGLAVSRRLFNSIGLNGNDYRLADGSGLSLYNYLSPELLVGLLRYAWRHPGIYQHLLPSLPIAGQDGTLKKRMRQGAAEGNVRAKTGTVTGVSALAGYCTAANGHELCFAIMNQGIMSSRQGRDFQDRVCSALCEP